MPEAGCKNNRFLLLVRFSPRSTHLAAIQILVAGLKFFLGKDEDEKRDSDSESEVSASGAMTLC